MAASRNASENGPLRIRDVPETLGGSGFGWVIREWTFFSPWHKLGGGFKNIVWMYGKRDLTGWVFLTRSCKAGWWFEIFFIFTPILGRIPNLMSIFFNWVGSTTNQSNVFRNASQNWQMENTRTQTVDWCFMMLLCFHFCLVFFSWWSHAFTGLA